MFDCGQAVVSVFDHGQAVVSVCDAGKVYSVCVTFNLVVVSGRTRGRMTDGAVRRREWGEREYVGIGRGPRACACRFLHARCNV